MEVKLTETLTHPLPETNQLTLSLEAFEPIKELLTRSQVVVLGPGMGLHDETAKLVRKLTTDSPIPIVIDADALTMISSEPSILKKAKAEIVITPHPGEAARLLKKTPEEIQSNRIGSSQKLATEYGVVCVLKGAATIVADQQANTFINPTGNPGMASGGTGDVLAGVIGGLIAQGLKVVDAAKVGVYLHGLAGDLVKEEKGEMSLVAKDLLTKLPEALLSLS
jgi:NAD(P)H-hydrate epimerase